MGIGVVYRLDGEDVYSLRGVEVKNFPENVWQSCENCPDIEDKYLKVVDGILVEMTESEKKIKDDLLELRKKQETLIYNSSIGNRILSECDWTQYLDIVPSGALTVEQQDQWAVFRQIVRTEKNKNIVVDWQAIRASAKDLKGSRFY